MFSKGFTIIEVVVAIFILSVALIGVYNAFSIVVILTADTKDRFTAAYLVQEGMEIVRNIRDGNWIVGDDWRCGLADTTGSAENCDVAIADINCTSGCQADYTTRTSAFTPYPMAQWSAGGNYLNIDADGFYIYDIADKETKFKRKITITPVSGNDSQGRPYSDYIMKVSVQVSWDEKPTILSPGSKAEDCGNSNCITAEEYLYNWY